MLIILNEGDRVDVNSSITVNLSECRKTVKSDGQIVYETGDIGIRPEERVYYVDADGILVSKA